MRIFVARYPNDARAERYRHLLDARVTPPAR
jgi:hypothetical protein